MVCPSSTASNEHDHENMITLSPILPPTTDSTVVESINIDLETFVVDSLVIGTSVSSITPTSGSSYTSPNGTFYANKVSSDLTAVFDLRTNAQHDDHFAISSTFQPPNDGSYYSSATSAIGTAVEKTISLVNPTVSLYDSHLKVLTVQNYGPFYDSDDTYSVEFNSSQSTNNIIRALNSAHNNDASANLMSASEYTSFNTTYALGNDLTQYYTSDSDGAPLPQDLDSSNVISNNDFNIEVTTTNFDPSMVGTYKIEQLTDVIGTYITTDPETLNPASINPATTNPTQNQLTLFPLRNTGIPIENLPRTLLPDNSIIYDSPTFNTLFSPAELAEVLPDFRYNIEVSTNVNSGYSFAAAVLQETDDTDIVTFDSSNLLDNLQYMEYLASCPHSFDLVNGSLTPETADENSATNNLDYFTINTVRESLSAEEWDSGKLLLNTRNPITRNTGTNSTDDSSSLSSRVYYNEELVDDNGTDFSGISHRIKTVEDAEYLTKLVFKSPATDGISHYAETSNFYLDLYDNSSGSLVSDSFTSNEVVLDVQNPDLFDSKSLTVFKITNNQKLSSIDGILDNNLVPVNNLSAHATVTNLPGLILDAPSTVNRMQIIASLKPISDISISADADANSWTLSNHGSTVVSSSTASAYRKVSPATSWPSVEDVRAVITSDGEYTIPYTVTLCVDNSIVSSGTGTSTSAYTHLEQNFYILITWVDSLGNDRSLQITNDDLRRTAQCSYSSNTITPLSGNRRKVQTNHTLQFIFDLQLNPYDAIELTTPVFSSTTVYYQTLRSGTVDDYNIDISPAELEGDSFTHEFSAVDGNLTFSGTLNAADLMELNASLISINDNDTISSSTSYPLSAFYGIPLNITLDSTSFANAHIVLVLEALTYATLSSSTQPYTINLAADPTNPNMCYSLSYFQSEFSADINTYDTYPDLIPRLSQHNPAEYMTSPKTVANGYSALPFAPNADVYSLSLTYSEDATTATLTVSDVDSESSIFTLTIANNKYLNTDAYITYCSNDIYSVTRNLSIVTDSTFSSSREVFIGTAYDIIIDSTPTFPVDDGIFVFNPVGFSSDLALGHGYDFSLLQDQISVNMISPITDVLSNIHHLSYQYVNSLDDSHFSRTLSIPYYRGYYGPFDTEQPYTLVRTHATATFKIATVRGDVTQTYTMYNESLYTVNSLSPLPLSPTLSSGDIGLHLSFSCSMLDDSDITSIPIYLIGDDITISLLNPNNTSWIASNHVTTLRLTDVDYYEFNGSLPLLLCPSRIRLRTNSCQTDYMAYSIYSLNVFLNIYKSDSYLGDPSLVTPSEWSLLYNIPNYSINGYSERISFTDNAYSNMGNFTLWRTLNSHFLPSVSYIVLAPPYLLFTQVSNNPTITALPFVLEDQPSNIITSYLPVSSDLELQVYNPFVSRVLEYSHPANNLTIAYDNTTNDTTITKQTFKPMSDYLYSPDETIYRFTVHGNYYTITLHLGLASAPSSILLATIFDGLADDLIDYSANETIPIGNNGPDLNPVSTSAYDRGLGTLTISFLQPLLTSYTDFIALGNPAFQYSLIYADAASPVPPTLFLKIDSLFLNAFGNGTSLATLDLPILQGININLYTRNIVVDPAGNIAVHIYRYEPFTNVFADHLNPIKQINQVDTIPFASRYYKIFPVDKIPIGTSVAQWPDMLQGLTATNASWQYDDSFDGAVTPIFLSLVNLTTSAKEEIYTTLFGCESSGESKFTYVVRDPLMVLYNKIRMPLFQITADGVIQAPLISTSGVSLTPVFNQPVNNQLINYPLTTVLGYPTSVTSTNIQLS